MINFLFISLLVLMLSRGIYSYLFSLTINLLTSLNTCLFPPRSRLPRHSYYCCCFSVTLFNNCSILFIFNFLFSFTSFTASIEFLLNSFHPSSPICLPRSYHLTVQTTEHERCTTLGTHPQKKKPFQVILYGNPPHKTHFQFCLI